MLEYTELYESLDEIYPITRNKPKLKALIYDEWEFEANGQMLTVRFSRLPIENFGRRVCKLEFGIRRGMHIRKKVSGISNIRKYLATIIRIVESALEEKTPELSKKSDGLVITMPTEIFSKHGRIFERVLRRKFRTILNFHGKYNEFSGDDEIKAFYVWKKGHQFRTVFANVDTSEPTDENLEDAESTPIAQSDRYHVSDRAKSRPLETPVMDVERIKLTKPKSLVTVKNPVISKQLVGADRKIKADLERLREVKRTNTDYNAYDIDIDDYFSAIVAYKFFERILEKLPGYARNKESSLGDTTIKVPLKWVKSLLSSKYKIDNSFGKDFLTEYEHLLALNLNGIKTHSPWDIFSWSRSNVVSGMEHSTLERKLVERAGISQESLRSLKFPPKRSATFKEAVEIVKDAKNILERHGIYASDEVKAEKYGSKNPLDLNLTAYGIVDGANLGKDEKIEVFKDIIASLNVHDLETYNPYEERRSRNNKKTTRQMKYGSNVQSIRNISSAESIIGEIAETPEEYIKYIDMLPSFAQGLHSTDEKIFETVWVQTWTAQGGSVAQLAAQKTLSDMGVNAELNDFWHIDRDTKVKEYLSYDVAKDKLQANFRKIYDRNQEFYRNKFKKKYEGKKLRLYRGVGLSIVDTYIPGALESWTVELSTAKRFAKIMSGTNREDYSILVAEVPIEHIFGCYQSFDETWPPEEDLLGKKEYIVMGGTFATTPIHTYNTVEKKELVRLQTFKEWTMMLQENEKGDKLKIVTPSMKNFNAILKSSKTAKGNDPAENEVRETKK